VAQDVAGKNTKIQTMMKRKRRGNGEKGEEALTGPTFARTSDRTWGGGHGGSCVSRGRASAFVARLLSGSNSRDILLRLGT